MNAIHMERYPNTPWAFCRSIRGVRVSKDWAHVTCRACLALRHRQFVGDYSHRHKAYSQALSQLRENHPHEFVALYRSALAITRSATPADKTKEE